MRRAIMIILVCLPFATVALPARASGEATMWQTVVTPDRDILVRSIERKRDPVRGLSGLYAIVVLDVTNTTSQPLSPRPADFTLWTDGRPSLNLAATSPGQTYVQSTGLTPLANNVAPGAVLTTALIFAIPPHAGRLTLDLATGETIRLDECKCNLPSPVRSVG